MATVGELIHTFQKAEVLATLARLYTGEGENPEGYSRVWDRLRDMQPEATTLDVILRYADADKDWVDVSGQERESGTIYAIEFTDWPEWLSMEIKLGPGLENAPPVEQLAHCLYEMTWMGYDQETIAAKLDDICDDVEEAKRAFGEKSPSQ